MKIKIIDPCVVGPAGAAEPGDVVDVPNHLGTLLVSMGRARPYEESPEVSGPLDTSAAPGLVPEGRKFDKRRKGG